MVLQCLPHNFFVYDCMIHLPKIFVIQQSQRHLSFRDGNRTYVIGFFEYKHAKLAANILTKYPHIQVQRTTPPLEDRFTNTAILDLDASLRISKIGTRTTTQSIIRQSDFDTFMRYPFEENTGVAMSYELVEDNAQELLFRVQIMDPTFSPENIHFSLE